MPIEFDFTRIYVSYLISLSSRAGFRWGGGSGAEWVTDQGFIHTFVIILMLQMIMNGISVQNEIFVE